jgi:hypothetical protein
MQIDSSFFVYISTEQRKSSRGKLALALVPQEPITPQPQAEKSNNRRTPEDSLV